MGSVAPVPRVLICDDARAFMVLLAHWLEEGDDFETLVPVADPDEAVRVAAVEAPEIIVLDHILGARTSADLIPMLRAAAPGAKIVLMSGMPHDVLERLAIVNGADGFVSKASTPEQIRAALLAVAE